MSVRTVPKPGVEAVETSEVNPGRFWDRRQMHLHAGQIANVDFKFIPFDAMAYRGTRSVTIRVLDQKGKPATGKKVQVLYHDGHYGYLEAFSGSVRDGGELKIDGITDRLSVGDIDPYLITIDGNRHDSFRLNQQDEVQDFEFRNHPCGW